VRIDDLVGAAAGAGGARLFFDRAHGGTLLVDHDEQLERGLTFPAR